MILKDKQGRVYKAHFRHFVEYKIEESHGSSPAVWVAEAPENLRVLGKRRATGCSLHFGYCVSEDRPCRGGRPEESEGGPAKNFYGVATCHSGGMDNFQRREGHRLSFFRALNKMLPPDGPPSNRVLRGELWESYFTKVKKPRKRGR